MRKLLLAGVALLALASAAPAVAQERGGLLGAGAGAGGGAITGGLLFGPVGAFVGGFAGALIGAEIGEEVVTYAVEHPVDVVYLDSDLDVGVTISGEVELHPIEGNDEYGYFYANDRVWIVELDSGEIVASPGYIVPERVVTYIEANPVDPVDIDIDLSPGVTIDADISIGEIPETRYGYVYVGERPVLVDRSTRTIIWVRE